MYPGGVRGKTLPVLWLSKNLGNLNLHPLRRSQLHGHQSPNWKLVEKLRVRHFGVGYREVARVLMLGTPQFPKEKLPVADEQTSFNI